MRSLMRLDPSARKLYRSGVRPQGHHNHVVLGAPPSQRQTARRIAGRCVGRAGYLPCRTTSLAFLLGNDPGFFLPTKQIKAWRATWRVMPSAFKADTRKAWRRLAPQLERLPANRRWSHAKGPMGATICTLLDFSWTPTLPIVWGAPDNEGQAVLDHHA